ncbi:MAG TPA: hypothetical protein VGC21_18010 [Telluria sp.]|jgi:hypothetical protein
MEHIRFIVRARQEGATLTEFLNTLQDDPHLEVLDTIGPANAPHTAVLAVEPDRVGDFEQRFLHSPTLMIERDRPLSLIDKTAGFLHRSERKTNA